MEMKLSIRTLLIATALLLLSHAAMAQTAAENGCSNATLFGNYAFTLSGQIYPPGGAAIQRDGVALTHFNGAGKLSQVDFVMSDGLPLAGPTNLNTGFHINEKGWYRVNSDCTGMAEIQFPIPPQGTSGAVIDLMFVLSEHGRVIHTVVSRVVPPNSNTPLPASIHSDAEKLSGF
jgi:hypothetical protein